MKTCRPKRPCFFPSGEEWVWWHANDGVFKGTPGYNNYEMQVGQVKVEDGEQVDFGMDDVQDGTLHGRCLGMRFERQPEVVITEFNVSPGVIEPTEDIFWKLVLHVG